MAYDICVFFVLFVAYSILGWMIEVTAVSIEKRKLVNRGFLIGPYCPIYGSGGILMVLLLKKYTEDPVVIFILAAVICSILEYVTSYVMEKLFKARWWDYSYRRFNLNGRICLRNMIIFGLMGTVMMYFINPIVLTVIKTFTEQVLYIITAILFIIFTIDISVSFSIINKVKEFAFEVRKDNTMEITEKVREILISKGILAKRLMEAYPNFISTIKSKKEELEERKAEFIRRAKTNIKDKELQLRKEIERFKIKK